MSCKAAIYTANQGAQVLQIGSVLSLGSIIRRFGCGVNLNGNGIVIDREGYYDVDASITATASAAGTVTATLLRDGVPVPGAVASATAAAAGTVALPITALVRQSCGCSGGSTLTLALGGTSATINNVALKVIKL